MEVLNHSKFSQWGTQLPGSVNDYKRGRLFKKARPARPQLLWRTERTREYVSTTKERERCWRRFSAASSQKRQVR